MGWTVDVGEKSEGRVDGSFISGARSLPYFTTGVAGGSTAQQSCN